MDQLKGVYLGTIQTLIVPMSSGVNKWVEHTPPTLLEQEQGIVCFGSLAMMNLEKNGLIALVVNGTIHH